MKLTKVGKIVVALLILIVGIITLIIYYQNKSDLSIKKIESNEFFDIKIDYEKTGIALLDEKVSEFVKNKRKQFIDIVDKAGRVETNKYNLIVNVKNNKYNDVLSIHALSFAYTGGAHYTREDESYVYDLKKEKYINFSDILVSDGFTNIEPIVLESLYDYAKEKDIILDEEWVKRGLSQSDSNYKYFYFSNQGLNITFPPYQVASWADGEITITIPYEKLGGILKSEYMDASLVTDITYPKPGKRDLSELEGKKLIAFTFDDGPNTKTTSRLLDGIKEFDARVTFFVLGSRVASNTEVLKRAYVEGNQIGSHTYNHLNLLLLDDANVLSEINLANDEIEKVIGIRPSLLRPPYGNINDHIKTLANMHIINWNIDTEDWKLKDRNLIKDKILESAHDGAIVLLHDIYTESVEGALMAMAELEQEGYAFVTIDEMINLKGVKLDYEKTYYNF